MTGAVAMYFMPGGPDGDINGIVVSIRRPTGEDLATASQIDCSRACRCRRRPINWSSRWPRTLRRQGIGAAQSGRLQVSCRCFDDPAMHGSVAGTGFARHRSGPAGTAAHHNGHVSWTFDPAKTPDGLAGRSPGVAADGRPGTDADFQPGHATNLPAARGAACAAGRCRRATSARRPWPATFYPGDPGRTACARSTSCWPAIQGVPSTLLGRDAAACRLSFFGRVLAAKTLASTRIPQTVIIIGPKHTNLGVEWAVAPHAAWQLPGMAVPSDPELARLLAEKIPGLELDAAAHQQEHGIEVELPFLARLAPTIARGGHRDGRRQSRALPGLCRRRWPK